NVGRFFLAGNQHARTGPGKAALPLLNVDAQGERREPRFVPDALRDILIERDGVAKSTAARMRRRREEADVRRVTAIDIRMPDTAENREILPMFFQVLQVGRQRIAAA